jgi:hypothetical protein
LVKCYLENKNKKDEDEDIEANYSEEIEQIRKQKSSVNSVKELDNQPKIKIEIKKEDDKEEDNCNFTTILICILLVILGIGLQPVYLLFYLLFAMMECYRRFGCWVFYFSF